MLQSPNDVNLDLAERAENAEAKVARLREALDDLVRAVDAMEEEYSTANADSLDDAMSRAVAAIRKKE